LRNIIKSKKKGLRHRTGTYIKGLQRLEFLPNFVVFSNSFYSAFGIRECNALALSSIGVVDSNVGAVEAFFPIFGNDDTISGVKLLLFVLTASFRAGRAVLIANYFNLIGSFVIRHLLNNNLR
jgi:ribosomal protein S2